MLFITVCGCFCLLSGKLVLYTRGPCQLVVAYFTYIHRYVIGLLDVLRILDVVLIIIDVSGTGLNCRRVGSSNELL
jgi:hypothetical protein